MNSKLDTQEKVGFISIAFGRFRGTYLNIYIVPMLAYTVIMQNGWWMVAIMLFSLPVLGWFMRFVDMSKVYISELEFTWRNSPYKRQLEEVEANLTAQIQELKRLIEAK